MSNKLKYSLVLVLSLLSVAATVKISDMVSATSIADADLFTIVQSGTNKKITWETLKTNVVVGVEAGTGVTTSTNAGVVTVNATGGSGADPRVVTNSYTRITNQFLCTTLMVADNSVPQNTEGDPVITNSFTMTSATNYLEITIDGHCSASGILTGVGAVFVGTETDARDVKYLPTIPAGGYIANMHTTFLITNGWTGTSNIVLRVGPTVAGTYYVNRNTTTATFGGRSHVIMHIKEMKP